VSDIDSQFKAKRQSDGPDDAEKLPGAFVFIRFIRVSPGVDFHESGADRATGSNLTWVGIDEKAGGNAPSFQPGDIFPELWLGSRDIQPSLGGEFLAFFRNKSNEIRFDPQGDLNHFFRICHFQVQPGLDRLAQQFQIAVLNVPPVFAQVDDDSVGPCQFREGCSGNRIRLLPASGLTQGGHMIDVYG
jgi:hypothetical protein